MSPEPHKSVHAIRVPDEPTAEDLLSIGLGSEKRGEQNHGMLVLDEAALFMNTSDYSKESLKALRRFFILIRRRRWDIYIICQHKDMIDKQIKKTLNAKIVYVQRWDNMPIFIITWLFAIFDIKVTWPRLHVGTVRIGDGAKDAKLSSWMARGNSLFKCYDTEQVFNEQYDTGIYTMLPPWLTDGRYLDPHRKIKRLIRRVKNVFTYKFTSYKSFFIAGGLLGVLGSTYAYANMVKTVQSEQVQIVKKALPQSNVNKLQGLYITGTLGKSYFFERNNSVFYPRHLGLTVAWIKPCKAALIDHLTQDRTIVTCNPVGVSTVDNPNSVQAPSMAIFGGLTTTEEEE